jgi:hypothetical protein
MMFKCSTKDVHCHVQFCKQLLFPISNQWTNTTICLLFISFRKREPVIGLLHYHSNILFGE